MRSRVQAVVLPAEVAEFNDELRRLFRDLGRVYGADALAGECSPPVDVFETDQSVDLVMDLPAVDAAAVRIVAKGDVVLIAGEKPARRVTPESTFHLVERGFGRFARAVRIARPCDPGRASATLNNGELHVRIPKIADRRGAPIEILVTAE